MCKSFSLSFFILLADSINWMSSLRQNPVIDSAVIFQSHFVVTLPLPQKVLEFYSLLPVHQETLYSYSPSHRRVHSTPQMLSQFRPIPYEECPTMATSSMLGCWTNSCSTSVGKMFTPPEIMTSFFRSITQ